MIEAKIRLEKLILKAKEALDKKPSMAGGIELAELLSDYQALTGSKY